jgi:hypothetical protein
MLGLLEKRCPVCDCVKNIDQFYKNVNICKSCYIARDMSRQKRNPIMVQTNNMIRRARSRAKKKNIPFDIDQAYIRSLVPSHCPILGIELEWSVQRGNGNCPLSNSPSLDRIVPEQGYVKGNVWIVSHRANTIKSDASYEELKLVTEAVGRAIVNSLES